MPKVQPTSTAEAIRYLLKCLPMLDEVQWLALLHCPGRSSTTYKITEDGVSDWNLDSAFRFGTILPLQNLKSLGYFKRLFSIKVGNFLTYFGIFYVIGLMLILVNGQLLKKKSSHQVTLKLDSILTTDDRHIQFRLHLSVYSLRRNCVHHFVCLELVVVVLIGKFTF